ncbi:hypothetical protein M8J76_002772 [Diaphorina citri]|nr:hypothetical protein M8J76_002772 [Diaphorina citri]
MKVSEYQPHSDTEELSKIYAHGNTNKDKLEEDLALVKTWLGYQAHLPTKAIDDNTIREYLIGSKGNVEKTKQKLDDRSSIRHDIRCFFVDRDISRPEFQNSLKTSNIVACPHLTKDATRLTIISFLPDDVSLYSAQIHKGRLFVGEDAILDMSIYTDRYREKLGIQTLVQWVNTLKVLPTRLNKFVIINSTGFIETMFKLVKPFLAEKLQNRDLGGTCPFTVRELSDYWVEQLKLNSDWVKNEANFFSDEEKRVKPRYGDEDTFGLQGTFRKINID